jgi:hypothetical protein
MQAMCKLVGAKTYHCSSLKPTANSRSENMNFQIAKILKATLTEQEDWADMLPSVCLSLRATPSTAHGFSPSYLMYGFDLRLPINMTLINDVNTSTDVDTYLRELIPKLEMARDAARMNMEDKNVITKNLHDKFAEYPRYKLGEKVLLHDPKVPVGKTAKLYRTWTGPFEILETYDNFLYKLKNCQTGKIIKSRIHSNRMKPYVERQPRKQRTQTDQRLTLPVNQQLPIADNTVATQNQVSHSNDNINVGSACKPHSSRPTAAVHTQPATSNSRVSKHPERTDSDPAIDVYYTVKDVTRKRFIGGKPHYFVHWEGNFPPSWEPESNLTETALAAYKARLKHQRKSNFYINRRASVQ